MLCRNEFSAEYGGRLFVVKWELNQRYADHTLLIFQRCLKKRRKNIENNNSRAWNSPCCNNLHFSLRFFSYGEEKWEYWRSILIKSIKTSYWIKLGHRKSFANVPLLWTACAAACSACTASCSGWEARGSWAASRLQASPPYPSPNTKEYYWEFRSRDTKITGSKSRWEPVLFELSFFSFGNFLSRQQERSLNIGWLTLNIPIRFNNVKYHRKHAHVDLCFNHQRWNFIHVWVARISPIDWIVIYQSYFFKYFSAKHIEPSSNERGNVVFL
jgi:hypothetical protein